MCLKNRSYNDQKSEQFGLNIQLKNLKENKGRSKNSQLSKIQSINNNLNFGS